MSSTSRGGQRSPADFYSTPAWPVHRLLERLALPGGHWFESSAGEGAIIKAVNAVRKDVIWEACELREECRPALLKAGVKNLLTGISFLDVSPGKPAWARDVEPSPVVCINNVPFSLAQEFIEHSLAFAPWVIHLLRLNYLGSEKRNEFFKSNMPDIYVIPNRVSFAQSVSCGMKDYCDFTAVLALDAEPLRTCPKCGGKTRISTTDSIEYAFYVWTPERARRSGKIEVLDHTPVEQRR